MPRHAVTFEIETFGLVSPQQITDAVAMLFRYGCFPFKKPAVITSGSADSFITETDPTEAEISTLLRKIALHSEKA